ncbi:MAG: hypothetical protein ACO3A4_06055 [Silvanigrellaceae bacterium]
MKSIYLVPLFCSLALVSNACGTKSAKKIAAIVAAENIGEYGAQSTDEAVSAASAGDSEGASGFSLSLSGSGSDSGSPYKTFSRTCAVQADGSALVTISSEISIEKSDSNDKVSRTFSRSGTSSEKRTWSHPSGVQCVSDKAKVNLKSDPTSYGLKVQIERTRKQTMSQTNTKKNTTISSSRSFSMNGERTVAIVSYSEDAAAGVSTQEKKVTGSMNRSFSFVDKDGATKTGSFSSTTVGDPMVVRVKRSLSSKEIVSRELVSGTRRNTLSDGSMIDTSFTNFLMTGSGESCQAQSGSLSLSYLDSEGAVTKSLSCSAESGVLSCTDSSGASVELESPSCDPADDK